MKKLMLSAVAAAALAVPGAAMADNHMDKKAKAEVVETNAKGQATKVRIDGKVYDVCMKDQQDGCINPREAGLKWGNRPLSYWPGKPASEIPGKMPQDRSGE